MYLKQFYLGCLSHASYLIADEKTKTAVVVDPQRDVDGYLVEARRKGLRIRHVLLTHFHADFISGHLELREQTKAAIHLGARAKAGYAFEAMKDGGALEFGDVRLEFMETPGHTPEAVCILVYDLKKSRTKPRAVLTGDTLFIGDVGRPDLMASIGVTARELARELYASLHEKLMELPDATLVYPAHGAGSMCGKNLSSETVSTIGAQRRHNYALKPMSREEFIRLVTADQPEAPAYFSYDAKMNRSRRPTLPKALKKSLKPLTLSAALKLRAGGAVCLDTREPSDYAGAHWRGSVNIGLGGRFASWAGILLDRRKPLVVVAEPGREQEAVLRLGRIGFDQVVGFLKGGMRALEKRADLVSSIERVDARSLREELASQRRPLILDVRNDAERASSRIAGSLHIPLNQLPRRLSEVPRNGRLVIHCASGYRSMVAASLVEKSGRKQTVDLQGGIAAWEAEKPVRA
ncbi:MAG: MBL fold metallo-hydrolase [Elusimicrobia bacterium]|nr:MBL fold metallo-hydrolase [Elusimicrobiota bacterium]